MGFGSVCKKQIRGRLFWESEMRKVGLWSVIILLVLCSQGFAVIVPAMFEPVSSSGNSLSFNLTFDCSEFSDFEAASFVVSSNAPISNISLTDTLKNVILPDEMGWVCDWSLDDPQLSAKLVGFALSASNPFEEFVPVGTVTVDLTGLPSNPEGYYVKIDGRQPDISEGCFSSLASSSGMAPIYGQARFNAIPEPASLLIFLGTGLLVRCRRSRT